MGIYVDNAATTKMSKAAIDEMNKCIEKYYGNPSSLYTLGTDAKSKLNSYRSIIANNLRCLANEIYFTSGGSESDTQAILSAAYAGLRVGKNHIISSTIEHHAVLRTLNKLKKDGFIITLLSPNKNGIINSQDVLKAIKDNTCLVSIMYVNNEIGTIQPIKEIAKICHDRNILFHTDAVQAGGKIKININDLDVDYLSLSGHKFHGAKGVGILFVKRNAPLENIIYGGDQEYGKRPGTENLPGIGATSIALKECMENIDDNQYKLKELSKYFIFKLSDIEDIKINGKPNYETGIINVMFKDVPSEQLLMLLSMYNIYTSSGSACNSKSGEPSHVLKGIGLTNEEANNSLRFSFGIDNTKEEIDKIIDILKININYLR